MVEGLVFATTLSFDLHGKMTIQEESFTTQFMMVSLAVMLILGTIIGNACFLAIIARFKVFRRNFTNIIVASLAVVDCLNALFNIPLFIIYFVVEANWLEGKTWAIISSSLHLEFGLLNLVSMSALMLDRFLAVCFGVKYFTWKTTKKAKIAVFLMWLVCTLVVVLAAIPVFYMDLDGLALTQARTMIFQERKVIIAPLMAFFTLASTVLGMLMGCSIHQKKKEVGKILNCIYHMVGNWVLLRLLHVVCFCMMQWLSNILV